LDASKFQYFNNFTYYSVFDNFLEKRQIFGYGFFQYFQKRFLELLIVIILMVVLSPFGLYIIYRVKRESPGKIFFMQRRIGYHGKPFVCYKFRSMHENSFHNPYTQENDDRIFPFGHLMRKMRMDELPQLWNVLKGDMHLVGPRAEWDILVEKYNQQIPLYYLRHLVKPGITGLAQVYYPYGRNLKDSKNKLKYDLFYIKRWSIGLELMILWKTVKVVLAQRGV